MTTSDEVKLSASVVYHWFLLSVVYAWTAWATSSATSHTGVGIKRCVVQVLDNLLDGLRGPVPANADRTR